MQSSFRAGLVLFGLVSLGDVAGLALTDGKHPPYAIAAIGTALGVASLYFVATAWRGRQASVRPLIALRIISAVTALPAFLVSNVPAGAEAAAGAVVLLTALGVVLVGRAPVSAAVTR